MGGGSGLPGAGAREQRSWTEFPCTPPTLGDSPWACDLRIRKQTGQALPPPHLRRDLLDLRLNSGSDGIQTTPSALSSTDREPLRELTVGTTRQEKVEWHPSDTSLRTSMRR